MSKYVVIITIVIVGLAGSGTALALDGSGTQEDPWRIKSLEDFNDFAADANYWAGFTRLETDVNLAGMIYSRAVIAPDVNSASSHFEGTAFIGVFDGNDHKILNLTIDDGGVGNGCLGLFGLINDAEVSRLGLVGGSVSGEYRVGSLVAYNLGNISNCYSTCSVSGDQGGVGGLVGENSGMISICYSIGEVGGFSHTGGLVGVNGGNISDCYSTGDVNAGYHSAGLVGLNLGGKHFITNCYSTGRVIGTGGLVGRNMPGAFIIASFWDIETSGKSNMCGYGSCDDSYGKTTAEMMQQSTFTDWDFINTWDIGENQTYPYLRVYLPSDINKDGIVNFLDVAITANQWMEGVE